MHGTAVAADQVVVVVTDTIFEPGRGTCGLDAPQQTLVDEGAERVVHGLAGNRADVGTHDVGKRVGGRVRMPGDRAQDREALSGDLQAVLAEQLGGLDRRIGRHVAQSETKTGQCQEFGIV